MPDSPDHADLVRRYLAEHDELHSESDRVFAICWAAKVQDALTTALSARLLVNAEHAERLTAFDGPFGNFSLMNDLAHSVGMIGDDVWHDINNIRQIRNKFAHWVTIADSQRVERKVTFETDCIRDWAKGLRCPDREPPVDAETDPLHPMRLPAPTEPRDRFMWTCLCLGEVFYRITAYHYAGRPRKEWPVFEYKT